MSKKFILLLFFCFLTFLFFGGCEGKKETPVKETKTKTEAIQENSNQAKKIAKEILPPSKSNIPPKVISAKIVPEPAFADTNLRIEVKAKDSEANLINYKYQWLEVKEGKTTKEAEELEGENTSTLSHDNFVHGDAIAVKIIPYNWYAEGKPFQTEFYIIQNSPPEIVSSPPEEISGTPFTYQVKAKDPDNDPIIFSLGEGAPEGMTINPTSGLVTWDIPPNTTGTFRIIVKGDDGHKGTCFQSFNLTVKSEPKKPKEGEKES